MIQNPILESEGSGASRAGVRVGLAILAASTLVTVTWIIFLIWMFAQLL
jgi:hypothetical protein